MAKNPLVATDVGMQGISNKRNTENNPKYV